MSYPFDFEFRETRNPKPESVFLIAEHLNLKTDRSAVAPDVIRGPSLFSENGKLIPALPLTAENGTRKAENRKRVPETLNLKTETLFQAHTRSTNRPV